MTRRPLQTFFSFATILSLALVLILSSSTQVAAQEKPFALREKTPLSPANVARYEELAGRYKTQVDGGHFDQAAMTRNQLMFLAIDQIDVNFYDFQKNTRKKRALFQTVLDVLEIGAKTAISITNGERAKSLIAEGLGFLQLSRSAVDKNFSLRETQILFNKMVSKRSQVLGGMLTKSVNSVEQYPFELALVDLINYYKAGTWEGALENLNIDTGDEAREATDRLEEIKLATPAELETSVLLRATLADLFKKLAPGNADAVRDEARTKLKAGLKAVPELLDGMRPAEVDQLTDAELDRVYRQVRQKLVRDRDKMKDLINATRQQD
jgi:hypothetical protein